MRPHPALVDGNQLARLDLPDDRCPHDVQRGGLAGHHPAAVEPAEHKRPEALRVTRRVEGVLVHEDQRVRAPDQRQRGQGGFLDPAALGIGRIRAGGTGEQGGQHVGVGRRAARHPRLVAGTSAASSSVLIRLPL